MKSSIVAVILPVLFSGMAFAADAGKATTTDWPNFRGPNHDGISTEKVAAWPKEGPKQLWKAELGPANSTASVLGGKVYAMGRDVKAKQDVVFCLNADNGAIVWKYPYEAVAGDYGGGPRATPAVDNTSVYTMSADGQVFCLDAASGKVTWSKNLLKEWNQKPQRHFLAGSPILEGNLVLLNIGETGTALDRKTGNVVWHSTSNASFSSTVPFNMGGKRVVAIFAATQLLIRDPANGQKIASYDWKSQDNDNDIDPIIMGDKIFVSAGYALEKRPGSALLSLSGDKISQVWSKGFRVDYASPVLVGDNLYALVEASYQKDDLVCVSIKDGVEKWRQKEVGSGGLMAADGKLIILSRSGDLILAEASPAAYKELARTTMFPGETVGGKAKPDICWAAPVLCNGRLYVRNEKGTLICLDVRGK